VVRIRRDRPEPFDAAFLNAVLALSAGQVGGPLEQPEGFVVVERLKDPPGGPAQIGAKHILIGYLGSPKELPKVTRSEAEARSLAEKIASEARKPDTDWNALAAQYTDEPGGKDRGGDLGKFGRGQMVDAFEKAAFALRVGETSDVIKSPFGFHIIRRYE
jgi:parvulin-like peptidyl-prolyl isomerase